MSHQPPSPLTPEERALADALARMEAPAGPSPRLDAAIRAAARSAIAPAAVDASPGAGMPPDAGGGHPAPATATPPRARRRPRRWAGVGIAASVVLAVGVAWQLRPLPSQEVAYDEAPLRMKGPPGMPTDASDGAVAPPPAPPAETPAASAAAAAPAQDAAQDAGREIAEEPSPPPAPAAEREQRPVVFDMPSPMDTPAPAPVADISRPTAQRAVAPPPAPPAPPPPSVPSTVADGVEVTGSRTATPASAARAERAAAPVAGRDRDPWPDDQPLDDQPPATFDAPDVRDAWMARIRELRDDGQLPAARDSLAEFRRRYPDLPLPADLRPLLD